MNNELINIIFNIILWGQSRKIRIIRQSRTTLLKINILQNLTQYLVYYKKYIKIFKQKKHILSYSKYSVKVGKLILPKFYFYFFKDFWLLCVIDC